MVMMCRKHVVVALTGLFSLISVAVLAQNNDRFNYVGTDGNSFGPNNWNQVSCDNIETCQGWPDKWSFSRGWNIKDNGNQCRDCSGNKCGEHRQGPVDLERRTGLNRTNNVWWRECQDVHWMKYHDGACDWDDMTDNPNAINRNNFYIREHALQVMQPIGNDGKLKCPSGQGGYFPKLDYSKGFPEWWLLSHMDIKVPSEFVQNGVRYDGQINYKQFYELAYTQQSPDGPRKKDGDVVIFLKAYDDVEPDPLLDKHICQFRKVENNVRDECGLPSVTTPYPGCWNYNRRGRRDRNLRSNTNYTNLEPQNLIPDFSHVVLDEEAIGPTDFDFDKFIGEQIAYGGGNGNWKGHELLDPKRQLIDYSHVPFHHYGFLINLRTEYYHRLETSQTTPPCQDNVHIRAMKDPLRVHPRQIAEIQRLLAERISPMGSPHKECQPYTAGAKMDGIGGGSSVNVARPLQGFHKKMQMTFCECKDWVSKWPEDREWCKIGNLWVGDPQNPASYKVGDTDRYFKHPYNYKNEDEEL